MSKTESRLDRVIFDHNVALAFPLQTTTRRLGAIVRRDRARRIQERLRHQYAIENQWTQEEILRREA